MNITIPLNSLVFVCDFQNILKNSFLKDSEKDKISFESELISFRDFKNSLYNNREVGYISKSRVKKAYLDYIDTKLFLGNRVIILLEKITDEDEELIRETIQLFYEKINIYFLISRDINRNLEKYLKSHCNMIKMNFSSEIKFCSEIKNDDCFIEKNFSGITVIGDVHGQKEKLINALDWARRNDNFVVFLGDLINYGPNSLECIEIVYDLIIRNKAINVLGNHERKMFKVLHGGNIYMNDAVEQTLNKINSLGEKEKNKWITKFNTLITYGKFFFKYRNVVFCHGGFVPKILNKNEDINKNDFLTSKEKNFCIFGDSEVFKIKVYRRKEISDIVNSPWVDEVQKDYILFLGHHTISNHYPFVFTNRNGAKIYFIDTGCGKGGSLTSADLKFTNDNKVIFKHFNVW
ncbi:MAG: metallophosphoesterase [Candidatus Aenigmatarchaeota archaeon]